MRLHIRRWSTPHGVTSLPHDVKFIAYARCVRWLGWGFGEPLIPVLLLSFSASFAQVGLFASIFEIALLLSLPIVASIADRTSARSVMLFGIALYPLVGVSYLVAGMLGSGLWIVISRVINAPLWAAELVGIETYYRRRAPHERLGAAFGYLDTISILGWMGAAFVGILLAQYISISVLISFTIPFAVAAYFIALRAPTDRPVSATHQSTALASYQAMWSELRGWNIDLHCIGLVTLFIGLLEPVSALFLPIYAYENGGSTTKVVLVGIAAAVPSLFAYHLGRFSDAVGAKRALTFCFSVVAAILAAACLFNMLPLTMSAAFLIAVVLELFHIVQKSYVTNHGPPRSYGRRGGLMAEIGTIGGIAGPLLIGTSFDAIGAPSTFLVLSFTSAAMAFLMWRIVRKR